MPSVIGAQVFRFAPVIETCCFPYCVNVAGACVFAYPTVEWEIDFGAGGWTQGGVCAAGQCESIQGIFTLDAWDTNPTGVQCGVDFHDGNPFCDALSDLDMIMLFTGGSFLFILSFQNGNAQIGYGRGVTSDELCGFCPSPVTLTKQFEFGIPCNGSLPNTITATRVA